MTAPYQPDRGPIGKIRRRLTRAYARRPAAHAPPPGGMITFTFDDAPASSAHDGAAVLEAKRVKGTWFISAGLCGAQDHLGRYATREEVADLHRRGHEVAGHTFSHLDCARVSTGAFLEDVELNQVFFREIGCDAETFAYPFGEVTFAAKKALAKQFTLLRTVQPGLLGRGADLAQAPSVGLQGPHGEAEALRWVARAAAEGAWVTLFTHDVRTAPSAWGCTPAALARVLDAALAAGLEVVTAAEGARRMGAGA